MLTWQHTFIISSYKVICCYFNLATRLYQLWQWAIVMLTWQYCIPLWIVVIYRYFNLTTHLCQFERFYPYFNIITLLPFFIEMLQYDWLWSGDMIIKVMFHIPMKLISELARASTTTSDVNNQWRSNFEQQII
jgi:hypothetical protein